MSDRFEDEEYLSWLKLSLALIYTKEALECFTDREVRVIHKRLKTLILGAPGSSTAVPPTCCSPTCTHIQLKKQWFQGKFNCPGNVCDKWITYILMDHQFPRQVVWENVNASKLPLEAWECMKLYLPFGNQKTSTVQEADLTALLTFYLDCKHFDNFFPDPVIPCQDIRKQVKDVRNRVMHSGQMKVDSTQLLADVATIKALLQDPTHLTRDAGCQEGVRKIDKLMADELELCFKKELESRVLNSKIPELEDKLMAGKLELSLNKELELRVLNSKMLALEDKVEQMQDEYEDISNELQTVSGVVVALRKDTAGNQEIQQFKQDIIELKNNIDGFTSFMKTHGVQGVDTSRLMQCESKLTSLSQSVEQKLKQHEQKLLQHDQTLHQHGQKHLECDQTLQQQGQKVQEHDQTLQQQGQKVQEHDQTLQQQGQKVQEHDQTIHQQGQKVQEHDQTLQQQGQKVQEHDQTLQQQGQKVQEHDQTLQQQGQKVHEHDQTLHQQGQKVQEHDQTLQQQGQKVQEHDQTLQQLVKANTFGIECSPEDVQHLRTVLLDAYKGMFQDITIFPGKTLDLEELYVKQEFKRIDHASKPGENNKPGKQASVASVADILTQNGKICKNILISAESGLGKSTFCKHLVRQWCKAYAPDNAKLTDDQKTLKRFELLFYFDLRDATVSPKVPNSDEISELIHERLDLKDTCSIAEIRKLLSGTSALVVMDSLDELASNRRPQRGIHNNSCIVTTSRPWKIEALRTTLIGVNQHIEIVGLTQTSPESLANNVLKLLNSGADDSEEKTGRAFITEMIKKKLQHLLNIPLLLIQMLGLWFGGDCFGDTQFQIYSEVIHHQILTAINSKELELPKHDSISSKRNFPCCISCSDQCPCKDYGELLWKIAKMAYHTLFSKEEKMCLVFDHVVTKMYDLSPEEVITCLKIGLLTQHTLFVKNPTKQKKQVNFPHKTNQEYFAAIFLSGEGQQSDLDHIRSVVSDLDRALELDKVLLFCSENNTAVASQLSRLISEIADKNPSVQEYRQSCDLSRYDAPHPHADLIEKIQNIIIPATQQNTKLFLSDIIIKGPQWRPQWRRFERQDRKPFVHHLDLTILKSLRISAHATDELLQSLKLCNNLQTLVLCDSGIKVEDIHEMVVRNKATLVTLLLVGEEYVGLKRGEPLDILTLGAQWRDMLTVNLSSLGLNDVKLSHEQCQDLSTFVATTNNLRQVQLERISCETQWHYKRGKCFMLDFRRNINLHTVVLSHLPSTDFHLQTDSLRSCEIYLPGVTAQTSILTQLKDASALQELKCWNINDTTSIFLLLDILPNFINLQRITLGGVEFGDVQNVCLSATMKKLEHVELYRCTITSAGLRCLINSLPNHNVKVMLRRVRVTDDENIFQDIRDSPNTNITRDYGVEKMEEGWWAGAFYFDNNNTRPGQA